LELYNNQIRDISQLSGLTNLESLQLYSNQISDISPLSRLTNLEFLKLYENQISNISAISELTNLRVLDLHNNQISDISPISGLTNLDHLYLSENQINNIYDLFRLTNLISLSLHGNQITDISSLVTNTGLGIFDHLWLDYSESTNPLSSEAMEIHIPILLAREFDLFTSPEVANQNTACYPFPNRDTDNIGYGSKLFWYGAESGTEYEVYLGSSEENLISIGEGEYIDESTFTISPELLPNTEYWWRVKSTTGEEELWSGMWHFTTGKNLTSVAKTTLYSAYPNPFNPSTTLSFSIGNEQNQQNQQIGLEIFNIKGQKVKTLDCINNIDAVTTPALVTYSIVWNGKDDYNQPVSSGVYFYKLKSKSTTQVRKMLLLK
jgi:Leucine-rich repeat (LRR) protein